ncbi:MAG: sodium/proline symporter PutP [Fusobacterium sp.]|nr:sodium/proline symporter PutP [Fusobacterium sp.]
MASFEVFTTFIIYLIFLIFIGVYFYKKNSTHEEYVLGGRGVGYWVTAMSAQASDMSGWLLLGLPGAVYLKGLTEIWVIIGLTIGTYLNWKLVAPRLRVLTEKYNSLTIPTFLEKKLNDTSGSIRIFSAAVILFFFTIYSASGLVASGKLFNSLLGIEYKWGVLIGGGTIIIYTFLGGYLACCWTDFFQGCLMFFAIITVPAVAYINGGGAEAIELAMRSKNISLNLLEYKEALSFPIIISGLGWGLGYFGQPHIIVRFMSIKNVNEIWKSRLIAMIWVIISLIGAIAIGLTGMAIFMDISKISGDAEKIFIFMIGKLFNPWITGILYAAILSAIMSTISSQLLVSSNTLTEDFYKYIIKRKKSNKELIWIGRICIIIIFIIASVLSLNPNSKVLELVSYAWAGFGGVFSPVILFSLYKKELYWKNIFISMIIATMTVIFWKTSGLSATIYEIVPTFLINCLLIYFLEKYKIFSEKK